MFLLPASVCQFSGFVFFGSSSVAASRVAVRLPFAASVAVVSGSGVAPVVSSVVGASGGSAAVWSPSRSVWSAVAGVVSYPRVGAVCVILCPSVAPSLSAWSRVSGSRFRGGSRSWALVAARGSAGLASLLVLPAGVRLAPQVFFWLRSLGFRRVSPGLWSCGL
jgi:hypothetical protein